MRAKLQAIELPTVTTTSSSAGVFVYTCSIVFVGERECVAVSVSVSVSVSMRYFKIRSKLQATELPTVTTTSSLAGVCVYVRVFGCEGKRVLVC